MPTYPQQVRAAERAARRKRRRRGTRGGLMACLRVAELKRIFAYRYGPTLPDDDAANEDLRIMLHHIAQTGPQPALKIADWLAAHADWMDVSTRMALTAQVLDKPLHWKAETLARRLRLTAADRRRLKIKTIGAVDETAAERAAIRKELKRQAQEARRRRVGVPTLAERRAKSISRTPPWTAAGVSRATYYRRLKTVRQLACPI